MASIYDLAGANANVDPILLQAIARVESGENDNIADSPAGAGGRMQFMPGTAAEYGVSNVRDPTQSIPAAARKMNDLINQHGSVASALMGYNGGNPSRWNNPETQAYPGKVAKSYADIVKERALASNQPQPSQSAAEDAADAAVMALPQKGVSKPQTPEDDAADAAVMSLPQKGVKPLSAMSDDELKAKGYQVLRSTPDDGNPVNQTMGQPSLEDRVPGIGTQAAVSMATDPDQKRRIMAARLFPGMPLKDALSRLTYGDDGRMIAVGTDNQRFYAEPSPSPRPLEPFRYENVINSLKPANIGSLAGPAIPMAGGIVGGALSSPTDLLLGPAGAAGGAAVGDIARQGIASYLDPGSQPYNLEQTGREAALAGVGQLGGAMVARTFAPNALLAPSHEISLIRKGAVMPGAESSYANASRQGIDLTPGQATGLPSLRMYEDTAAQNPAYADAVDAFYKKQGAQTNTAANNLLSTISPTADKNVAAANFQAGADPAISGVRAQANKLAGPQFAQAEAGGNVMTPDLAQISEAPAVQDALAKARIIYQNKYGKPPDTPDFKLWQETKHVLDDAVDAASQNTDSSGGRSVASGINSVRQRFIGALDDAYPTYANARAIAAPGHAEAAQLQDAALGKIADAGTDQLARPTLAPMFERSNPQAIARARDAYVSTGQEPAWNDGVRAYLQDAIDKSSTSMDGLNPAMLRRNVWNKPDIRANMQASMTPDQFKGFNNFVDTLEDLSKTFPANSATDRRGVARGALQTAASDTPVNNLLGTIGKIGSPQAYLKGLPTITDPIQNWLTGRNVKQVIGNLFAPPGPDGVNALNMLSQMANIPPKSQNATAAALQLLSRTAPSLPANDAGTSQSSLQSGNRLMPATR